VLRHVHTHRVIAPGATFWRTKESFDVPVCSILLWATRSIHNAVLVKLLTRTSISPSTWHHPLQLFPSSLVSSVRTLYVQPQVEAHVETKSSELLKPVLKAFLDDGDCAAACTVLTHFIRTVKGILFQQWLDVLSPWLTASKLFRFVPANSVLGPWEVFLLLSCYYYSKSRITPLYICLKQTHIKVLFYQTLQLLPQLFILRVVKQIIFQNVSTFALTAWYKYISSAIFYLNLYSNLGKYSKSVKMIADTEVAYPQ
jgi:hypothetical protein